MICPFCSLLCDNSQAIDDCSLRIRCLENIKKRATWEESTELLVAKAKEWLEHSESVMITGRIVSVETSRAALRFAKEVHGVVDCSDREVTMDAASAMSKTGACSISIAEVRDLSDVIFVLGDDEMMDRFPNLASCLAKRERTPVIILLGEHTSKSLNCWMQFFPETWSLECAIDRIPEALHSFFELKVESSNSDSSNRLSSDVLYQQLQDANYISLVWAPNSIGANTVEAGGRAAWIERLLEHQITWNKNRRIGSLALSGQDSVFQQVCLWTTGYPGRVSFINDTIDFDPARHTVSRWISENKHASNALLIEVDETANESNDWLDAQMMDFNGKRIVVSFSGRPDTKDHFSAIHLPTQVAGFDRPADMLRADQTVLARVPEDQTTRTSSVWSVSQWMEALSR